MVSVVCWLVENKISKWTQPGMDCAVLQAVDKIIDNKYCSQTYNYYMCETEGNTLIIQS